MQPGSSIISLPVLQQIDPLRHQPDQGFGGDGISPMDPPDAYAPPGLDPIDRTDWHPFLQRLGEEHEVLSGHLNQAEEAILSVATAGFSEQLQQRLLGLCEAVDRDFIPHSRREEAALFPLLHRRLIEAGEHSSSESPTTAVNVMLDEHLKIVQLATVVSNYLRLGPCLPDRTSMLILRDAALRHAWILVESLQLHIFREDKIVFPAAQRLLSASEMDRLAAESRSGLPV